MFSQLPSGFCSCGNPGCQSIGKHPQAPTGWADAPDITAEQAERIWSRLSGASIGLRMGRGHAYVRVASGSTVSAGLDKPYPPTLAWRSIEATFYIFRGDDRGRDLRPGVTFRGKGCVLVAPPNPLLTVLSEIEPAPLPKWWDL